MRGSLLFTSLLLLLNPPPRASIVDGVIVRDAETQAAIEATAGTSLTRSRSDSYRLVVTKSRYRLDVRDGDRVVKVFPIALGGEPEGAKARQGDHRTPEGTYVLIPHHESPGFGTCFYICYPNELDASAAKARGLVGKATVASIVSSLKRQAPPASDTSLGGLILLHGVKKRSLVGLTSMNWTDGCVAMENANLLELLAVYRSSDRPELRIDP